MTDPPIYDPVLPFKPCILLSYIIFLFQIVVFAFSNIYALFPSSFPPFAFRSSFCLKHSLLSLCDLTHQLPLTVVNSSLLTPVKSFLRPLNLYNPLLQSQTLKTLLFLYLILLKYKRTYYLLYIFVFFLLHPISPA